MTLESFLEGASRKEAPPATMGLPLQALWADFSDDWENAHKLAQEASSREGDWVHAYLHRKEGDASNAAYWYQRAQRPVFTGSLDEERDKIIQELLTFEDPI